MAQYLSHLNLFDIFLVSIVFISTVFAMFRGFIKAVFSLLTWVLAAVSTFLLRPYAQEVIANKIDNQKLVIVLSSLGVFLIVFIIFAAINARIIYSMRKVAGGFIDRFFGFWFGALRGVLIACLIFFSLDMASSMLHLGRNPDRPGPEWLAKAGTYELLQKTSSIIVSFAPEDMPQQLEKFIDKLKDVTLASVGEELDASSTNVKTLSEDDRKLMKQIILALSKEDLAEIDKKYGNNPVGISEFEKIESFKDIILLYRQNLQQKKIPADQIIPEVKLEELEKSLSENKPVDKDNKTGGGDGYKNDSIKQLDRLIESGQSN